MALIDSRRRLIARTTSIGYVFSGPPLPVPYAPRQQPNWCWAGCTDMLLQYLARSETQCRIAEQVLDRTCCPSPDSCNQPVNDSRLNAYYQANAIPLSYANTSVPSEADLQSLLASTPVMAGVSGATSGHLVLVAGYRDYHSSPVDYFFLVHDPDPTKGDDGRRFVKYSKLKNGLDENGWNRWDAFWVIQ